MEYTTPGNATLRSGKFNSTNREIGDPGVKLHWLERRDKGVPVTLALQKQILQLKRELNLQQYKFPFETETV
jgi:hypothetical protein